MTVKTALRGVANFQLTLARCRVSCDVFQLELPANDPLWLFIQFDLLGSTWARVGSLFDFRVKWDEDSRV